MRHLKNYILLLTILTLQNCQNEKVNPKSDNLELLTTVSVSKEEKLLKGFEYIRALTPPAGRVSQASIEKFLLDSAIRRIDKETGSTNYSLTIAKDFPKSLTNLVVTENKGAYLAIIVEYISDTQEKGWDLKNFRGKMRLTSLKGKNENWIAINPTESKGGRTNFCSSHIETIIVTGGGYTNTYYETVLSCYPDSGGLLTTEPFGYYVYQPGNDLEVFPGKTGISGGGETTTVSPSDNLLNSITNETSLDQTQQDNLRAAFNEVYSKCSNKNFINSLKNNGFAFRFKIDPNLSTPGGYDPATNTIKFRSTADVNFDTLQEELFHAYQNLTANISGTLNPPYTGRSNVEFESKVYRDIVCVLGGGACSYWGGDTDEYASWLIEITSGWTTYPTWDKMQSKYFRFLVEFVNYNPSYNFPIDYSLAPTAIFKAYNGCKP